MRDVRLFELPDRLDEDFTAHNGESKALWEAFAQNKHRRIPVRLNTNPRMLMLDPAHNTRGVTYREYMTDPEVMGQAVLEWLYWQRFLLPGDHEKGLPDTWQVHIDFENVYDAAWFGAPVDFHDGQVPYAPPILHEDNKRTLFDHGVPDPFAGEWAERALRFHEYFSEKSKAGWTFLGRPVVPAPFTPFVYFDGVFTTAAALRGPTELCTDLLADPGYVRELLAYITTAVIARIAAWRKWAGQPEKADGWWAADDSIEMLSVDQYLDFVLPEHRRFFDALTTGNGRFIHLCGNAQRFFPVLKETLGITAFDTGFPVDFARFRKEMGPDVLLSGGPKAPLFVEDSPESLLLETTRILTSGVLEGGRFILQEGNNLPPCARLENCRQFYALGKALGGAAHDRK